MTSAALAVALMAGGWSMSAQAFVLGQVRVFSALGQPLVAEIPVQQLTADEAASLQVRLGSPAEFEAQGVPYAGAVASVRASVQRHASGDGVIRLSSAQAIQEPFVDVLLDLTWNSGSLRRNYTMLFDPPKIAQPAAGAVTTAPIVSGSRQPAVPAPAPTRPAPAAAAPQATAEAAESTPRRSAPRRPETVRVAPGQTLGQIAASVKPQSVSMEQMLVALYQANPRAFIDQNLNRVRAGAVLAVPSASTASGVSRTQARQVVAAHSRDFSEYRRRLAGLAAPAPADAAGRTAGGAVTAEVKDASKPAAPAPDKLTLSKAGNAEDEKRIAAAGNQSDAQARQAELDKNMADLKKVADSAATGAAPAPGAAGQPPAGNRADRPSGQQAGDASAVTAAAQPAAPAPQPVPKPAAKPAAPAPVAETSFIDDLMENPMLPFGGLALIILLGGYGAYRYIQKRKVAQAAAASAVQPASDSFFGESGGQQVDTTETGGNTATTSSLMTYSPSQLDAGGEVDPVAEADVYLAYGRDDQAEDILRDALQLTPERSALHAKLCEIYAKQGKIAEFDAQAKRAHDITQGRGADWAQIAKLGRGLSPSNELYQDHGAATIFPPVAPASAPKPSPAPAAVAPAAVAPAAPVAKRAPTAGEDSLDTLPPQVPVASRTLSAPAFPAPAAPAPAASVPEAFRQSVSGIDLDLGGPTTVPTPLPEVKPVSAMPKASDQDMHYGSTKPVPLVELDLAPQGSRTPAKPADAPLELDLPDLSLDLPGATASRPAAGADDLATRLSLAEEFQAIGNDEGAREIAREVVAKASGDVKARAEKLLAQLH